MNFNQGNNTKMKMTKKISDEVSLQNFVVHNSFKATLGWNLGFHKYRSYKMQGISEKLYVRLSCKTQVPITKISKLME